MKTFKNLVFVIMMLMSILALYQCKSIPKLETKTPSGIQSVYYQNWNAGIKEGGSGVNVYIETDTLINLDSIYFRGKVAKLQANPKNSSLYIGRFKSNVKSSSWSFQIKDDDCVVSYLDANKVRYFKISEIEKRKPLNYPSTTSNDL